MVSQDPMYPEKGAFVHVQNVGVMRKRARPVITLFLPLLTGSVPRPSHACCASLHRAPWRRRLQSLLWRTRVVLLRNGHQPVTASGALIAEIFVMSKRKLFIFIIKKCICSIEISKPAFHSIVHTYLAGSPRCTYCCGCFSGASGCSGICQCSCSPWG